MQAAEKRSVFKEWNKALRREGLGVDEHRWEKESWVYLDDIVRSAAEGLVDVEELWDATEDAHPERLAHERRQEFVRTLVFGMAPLGLVTSRSNASHWDRASRFGVLSTLTHRQLWATIDAADGRCIYCTNRTDLIADHLEPMSRGGANAVWNIVPACIPCNSSKSNNELEEWCRRSGRSFRLLSARIDDFQRRLVAVVGAEAMYVGGAS